MIQEEVRVCCVPDLLESRESPSGVQGSHKVGNAGKPIPSILVPSNSKGGQVGRTLSYQSYHDSDSREGGFLDGDGGDGARSSSRRH